jgi:hypothetical protein
MWGRRAALQLDLNSGGTAARGGIIFWRKPSPQSVALGAATKWLETEYGTNFDTKAEVGPVKLLVTLLSQTSSTQLELQRSAGRGVEMPTYRISHREGLKQMFGDKVVDALRPRW